METNAPQTPSSPDDTTPFSTLTNTPINTPFSTPVSSPIQDKVSTPARRKGPNVSAIILGLVAVVLAGLIIANETTGLQVDWSQLGPGAIVGIGLLLVILGAIGLVRRHDDA